MTVSELRERITAEEFAKWQAFMEIEPDIGTRADYLAAHLAVFLTRVEAVMGGDPPHIEGKLFNWGKSSDGK